MYESRVSACIDLFGLALTLIFSTRGFAVAVWTHAIYDIWVLALKGS